MKESFWLILILGLGIICIAFISFFQSYTNTDEQNYQLIKEVTEAAMFDAFDEAAYKATGEIRIDREKFVENFLRRFAESASISDNYNIKIYDVSERPPKVSLQVSSKINSNFTTKKNQNIITGKTEIMEFDIVNKLDAILETVY